MPLAAYGYWFCPHRDMICRDPACGMGASCAVMRAIGLPGDGSPLRQGDRPTCGARNRQGPTMRHADRGRKAPLPISRLSTGPRTAEGKARIAAAQRRRWAAFREGRKRA